MRRQRIRQKGPLHYSVIVVIFFFVVSQAATARSSSDNALRLPTRPGPFWETHVITQRHANFQPSPSILRAATSTSTTTTKKLLQIRGGGGDASAAIASGGGYLASLLTVGGGRGKQRMMQVAVVSATAVSLIHGVIDMLLPSAVCKYYNVPPATSMPGMEEILIRRIGALLLATGLVAVAVFFSSAAPNDSSSWSILPAVWKLQTLDQAVALTTLVFWLESFYILVKRLPSKMEFDATATWTSFLVNSAFLGVYLSAFMAQGPNATVLITKWIIRIVLAHGILGIVAPSAVLALGGFPPPRKNQDLAVVLGVTRAAGYWGLAFAIFAMSVLDNVPHHGDWTTTTTLHHLRGFAYSRLVILFRSVYMNFASREVYTSLRFKQAFWLVFDFFVAGVLSQSFFWTPTPASAATVVQDMHQHGNLSV